MEISILLKAIIDNAIDGIIIINHQGVIELVNPSVCNLFEYQENELLGSHIGLLMGLKDGDNQSNYVRQYLLKRQPKIIGIDREVQGITKQGFILPFRLAVSKVVIDGRILFTGIVQDLSHEKRAENALRQHAEQLEKVVNERTSELQETICRLKEIEAETNTSLTIEKEMNSMKSRFISMASHEFRSPLSSIQLSASLIEKYYERLDKEKIFQHLSRIKHAVSDLTETLNDFLSVERIENGQISPVYCEFNLEVFVEDVVEEMNLLKKNGQIITYTHKGKNVKCMLDKNLLKHSLINLLSNAIKYSGEDRLIEVCTEIDDLECTIKVKDNGIGIPDAEQAQLFRPFFRAGNTREVSGTGLGLNIVERYVNLMNGSITFESKENWGTQFKLSFPVHIYPL